MDSEEKQDFMDSVFEEMSSIQNLDKYLKNIRQSALEKASELLVAGDSKGALLNAAIAVHYAELEQDLSLFLEQS
ncbi:MAG TPA: hypothetical protein EYP39_01465 [Ghiorsea sp.]|nr:hypothetical protein [Ghiorsea sp.]